MSSLTTTSSSILHTGGTCRTLNVQGTCIEAGQYVLRWDQAAMLPPQYPAGLDSHKELTSVLGVM